MTHIEPGIHRKPTKIDYDVIAKRYGLKKPHNWSGFIDPSKLMSIPGMTKENPIRNLTPERLVYLVQRYARTMCVLWIEITPVIAQLILDEFNLLNRHMNRRGKHEYLAAILGGKFYPTTVTVRFDSNGAFFDGQHRMWIIAQSDKPMVMPIGFGELPIVAQLVTDIGRPRSARDQSSIATGVAISSPAMFVARHMFQSSPDFANGRGLTGRPMSTIEVQTSYEYYCLVIERAVSRVLKKAGLGFPKAVAAVVARAYLAQPWEVIDRFCEVISITGSDMTSMPKRTWEIATLMFRDAIKQDIYVKGRHDEDYVLVYRMTEMALWNFIHQITPSKLEAAKKELFPMTEVNTLVNDLEHGNRSYVEQEKIFVADTPSGRVVNKSALVAKKTRKVPAIQKCSSK